jgi:hypothetical protein
MKWKNTSSQLPHKFFIGSSKQFDMIKMIKRKELEKMKKIIIGILAGAVIIGGAATYTFADTNENNQFFNEMRPYMEKMHPNFSNEDYEAMFNFCHGNGQFNRGPQKEFDRPNE